MKPFSQFINETEMVSFSGFCRTIGWLVAILGFAGAGCFLLILGGLRAVKGDGSNEALTIGLQVTITVLGGLGVASGIGAVNTKTVRTTAKEYAPVAEAKERGKASGAVALHAENVQKVEVTRGSETANAQPEPEWSKGDPRAGVL